MDHSAFAFCLVVPGIFTIYCSHGVCCGFEVIWLHESPKHPFEIFLTCFETPPEIIIYDNSCKLHQFVLNRQHQILRVVYENFTSGIWDLYHLFWPIKFQHLLQLGSEDLYATTLITNINSQVNEQANAGLQHIKGQIAYMKPDNFMFHVQLFSKYY